SDEESNHSNCNISLPELSSYEEKDFYLDEIEEISYELNIGKLNSKDNNLLQQRDAVLPNDVIALTPALPLANEIELQENLMRRIEVLLGEISRLRKEAQDRIRRFQRKQQE
ncbi:25938_t:CDS:2, partial [Dentiscutata erythropus]